MTAWAVVYLAALAGIVGGLVATPEHTVKGYVGLVLGLAVFVTGAVLAVHAL